MKLVLAEKPSVAQSIAKVLGAAKREDGYLEGNGYVVSWCVGHLVELAQPEVYDAKYSKWAYADLPIFPMDWQYEVSAGTKKQFGILKKLMAREDVASLVCATDAGREGELIFRLVYHKAGCRKPFERLWISSMEDVAIKEGFENLRSGTEYDALYEAALCRERADWIVGINATRLFSTLYGQTLNVGRVMTPTLAMAVMREAAISAFKPELFYTVQIGLDGFTAASERFKTKAAAEAVKQSCSVAIVQKAECKEKTEKPPALYDLTSLQREANRVLGYTAQQTLDYTQNLYEKKLVTYPRTDSRFLTEDMAHSLTDLVKLAFHTFPVEDVDIIYNSTSLDATRKFKNFFLSGLAVQRLSDMVCLEHGLSIITPKPYRERQKRTVYPKKRTQRDELCDAIDAVLKQKPKSFDGFVQALADMGFEFKDGKQPAFKGENQKRFIRLRSLGEGYSKEEIQAVISGKNLHKSKGGSAKAPAPKQFQMLIDIQAKMAEGKTVGYEKWAKKFNRKEAARTVILLKEKGLGNYDDLTAHIENLSARFDALSDSIKVAEKRMKELNIWEGEVPKVKTPMISDNPDDVSYLNATASGLFIPYVKHGAKLKKGDLIGKIVDPLQGKVLDEVICPTDGMLFTIREYPIVDEGSLMGRVLNKEVCSFE